MNNITEEQWNKAYKHAVYMQELHHELGFLGIYNYVYITRLIERYNDGERTPELYEDLTHIL